MKTNKSYKKRIKVTRTGKMVTRSKGHNHYNSAETGRKGISKRRSDTTSLRMTNKTKKRFLSNISANK